MSGPLSGIRVVELSTFVAGPVTARLLADMGADVIKVESPAGDGWRNSGIGYNRERFSNDENPVFDIYNTGKKLISLNLKSKEGSEVMHKLLSEADVFITNTRPAALQRLGLSYEELKDRYPQLIYAIVLGYGEKGPDAGKPAFDTTAFWSRSGFMRDMAPLTEDYYPMATPSSVGDTATAYLLMGEISTALFNRTRTGKGDYVSSTLYHNGVFCMGTMGIIAQKPYGKNFPVSRIDQGAPQGCYACADGEWIFFAPGNHAVNFPKYCRLIGRIDLMDDPIMKPENCWANRHIIYPIFRDAFLTNPAAYWVEQAALEDLPLVRMAHFSDVSEDEQAWANGFVENVQFPSGNVDVMPTSPIEMASAAPPATQPVPLGITGH